MVIDLLTYMCGCQAWIYIEQLCAPITILHYFEDESVLLRIRILPNSQVGLTTCDMSNTLRSSGGNSPSDSNDTLEEIIFQAEEALIPHQKWVHIAIGGRRSPTAPAGGPDSEVKLVLNGKRCGRPIRCGYPKASKQNSGATSVVMGETGGDQPSVPGDEMFKGLDASSWYLGPCTLIAQYVTDDLALLLHHLGPRYEGNFQEPLAKFLTYEGATALNIYLTHLSKVTKQGGVRPILPSNSHLIKAIKEGKVFQDGNVLFSFNARNVVPNPKPSKRMRLEERLDRPRFTVLNSSVPANEFSPPAIMAMLEGDLFSMHFHPLDMSFNAIGGPLSALRLVEMTRSPAQLQSALSILFEMVKEDWSASEEMERMRGYDILASLLRTKMQEQVNTSIVRALFAALGINFDKPETSTILNSAAYRAIVLRLEVWSRASRDVVELVFQNFEHLLVDSKYKRFNTVRCFRNVGLVRKILHALKGNAFDSTAVPAIVSSTHKILLAHWSADDSIKPLFAYLIGTLCPAGQLPFNMVPAAMTSPMQTQLPSALLLAAVADICASSETHCAKLQSVLAVHQVLVVLLTCNPAAFVVGPCMSMVTTILTSSTGAQFRQKFEREGGFELLIKTTPPVWDLEIQKLIFKALEERQEDEWVNEALFPCVTSALERLVQSAFEESAPTPTQRMPIHQGNNSSLATSPSSPPESESPDTSNIVLLTKLLDTLNDCLEEHDTYSSMLTVMQVDSLIPCIADFASISITPGGGSVGTERTRAQLDRFLVNVTQMLELPSITSSQISALLEQLRASGQSTMSATPLSSSAHSARTIMSQFSPRTPSQFAPTSPGRSTKRLALSRNPSSRRNFFSRKIPLIRRLTGDSSLNEVKDKNLAWKQSIVSAEAAKFAATTLKT